MHNVDGIGNLVFQMKNYALWKYPPTRRSPPVLMCYAPHPIGVVITADPVKFREGGSREMQGGWVLHLETVWMSAPMESIAQVKTFLLQLAF